MCSRVRYRRSHFVGALFTTLISRNPLGKVPQIAFVVQDRNATRSLLPGILWPRPGRLCHRNANFLSPKVKGRRARFLYWGLRQYGRPICRNFFLFFSSPGPCRGSQGKLDFSAFIHRGSFRLDLA